MNRKEKDYSLPEFCLRLKLGIWRTGAVAGWGRVEIVAVHAGDSAVAPHRRRCRDAETATGYTGGVTDWGFFIRKPPEAYVRSPLAKERPGRGLILLDSYCTTTKNAAKESVRIAVVAVCRATTECIEAVYLLRITDRSDGGTRSSGSSGHDYFGGARARDRIDARRLGSRTRKY